MEHVYCQFVETFNSLVFTDVCFLPKGRHITGCIGDTISKREKLEHYHHMRKRKRIVRFLYESANNFLAIYGENSNEMKCYAKNSYKTT